ncbi:hypothetical protein, partial [Roseiflexus castenholzii]|uniref:hypothetical protein n=1 Tax=Roseiflexus castenholzii TaxID=120962 RepID=UPI003C7D9F98
MGLRASSRPWWIAIGACHPRRLSSTKDAKGREGNLAGFRTSCFFVPFEDHAMVDRHWRLSSTKDAKGREGNLAGFRTSCFFVPFEDHAMVDRHWRLSSTKDAKGREGNLAG